MANHTRKFDWAEAADLRRQLWSYPEIARHCGVTVKAVRNALNPAERARDAALCQRYQQGGICTVCGAPASRRYAPMMSRCRPCFNRARATSVRPDELRCSSCRDWKPDADFAKGTGYPARRGRRNTCKLCDHAAKRRWRERTGRLSV